MSDEACLPAQYDKRDIVRHYNNMSTRYDLWGRLTESKARTRCLELAAIQDGEAVLEVAVGTGLAFQEVLRHNPSGRNEGMDLTPQMLAQAQQKAAQVGHNNYTLRLGDAYQLDYPAATFDVLINNYMFDLLPEGDFVMVLREFGRVLRPGGRLVLVNMTRAWLWHQKIWQWAYTQNPRWTGGCRGVNLTSSLQAAGFRLTQRDAISQMTLPSEAILAHKI
ncbi:MAG: methyltransferase domain-containing protein [Anaerolineales bacterium]|nr:methyltransferase domain-containing protein [Anaerolineales bacterium]